MLEIQMINTVETGHEEAPPTVPTSEHTAETQTQDHEPAAPEGMIDAAVTALKARDWPRALKLVQPYIDEVVRPSFDARSIYSANELIAGARLGAATFEQTGEFQKSHMVWHALFRRAHQMGADDKLALGDRVSLIRVAARAGEFHEASRRGFSAMVNQLHKTGTLPAKEFRLLVGVARHHIGEHFLQSGEPDQAFHAFGKALYYARKHTDVFNGVRDHIEQMHREMLKLGRELERDTWNATPLKALGPDAWRMDSAQ